MSDNNLIKIVSWKGYLLLFAICVTASLLGGMIIYHFFIVGEDKASLLSSIATLAIAVMTIFLVFVTYRNVKATRDNIYGQILLQLSSDYASDKMLGAMRHLRKWQQEYKDSFAQRFVEERDNNLKWEYDQYRRRISHHFYQIYLLHKSKVIDDRFLKVLVMQGKLDFLLEINRPIEIELAKILAERQGDERKFRFTEEVFDFFEQARERLG